jgi:hypothetical protein
VELLSWITGAILLIIMLASVLRAGVFQAAGLTDEAGLISGGPLTDLHTMTMHLYSNNHSPTTADTLASYTECAFTGYAAVALNTVWTVGPISGDSITMKSLTAIFTQSASPVNDNCYGYYLTDGGGNLFAAELLSGGPFAFNANGKSLQVTVTETLTRV